MVRVQVIAIFIAFFLVNNIQERLFKKRNFEIVGRPPVPERVFKIGRLSLVCAWLLSLVQASGLNLRLVRVPAPAEAAALGLFYAGFFITLLAYLQLAEANKMGLPDERTTLKTGGIYKISRNPLYSGLLLIVLASVIYTANPSTLLLAAMACAVYYRVILAEEDFLKERFGVEYLAYKARTRRFL